MFTWNVYSLLCAYISRAVVTIGFEQSAYVFAEDGGPRTIGIAVLSGELERNATVEVNTADATAIGQR